MVEHRRLGGPCSPAVVVDGNGMDDLGEDTPLQPAGVRLDQPDPELDVAEQATFLGRAERGPAAELQRPAGVVEQRRGKDEVAAETWVHLGRLAAERGDGDRVLEEAACVRVVCLGAGGKLAQTGAEALV